MYQKRNDSSSETQPLKRRNLICKAHFSTITYFISRYGKPVLLFKKNNNGVKNPKSFLTCEVSFNWANDRDITRADELWIQESPCKPRFKKKTTNQQAPEGLCASLDHNLLFSVICFICTLPSLFVVKTALYFAHVQISEHFLEKDVWEPYWVYCSVTLNVVSDYSILYLRHNELNKKNI